MVQYLVLVRDIAELKRLSDIKRCARENSRLFGCFLCLLCTGSGTVRLLLCRFVTVDKTWNTQRPWSCRNSGTHRRTWSQESGEWLIGRKESDHRFQRFTSCDRHGLPEETQNGSRPLLCWIIVTMQRLIVKWATPFNEKKLSFH